PADREAALRAGIHEAAGVDGERSSAPDAGRERDPVDAVVGAAQQPAAAHGEQAAWPGRVDRREPACGHEARPEQGELATEVPRACPAAGRLDQQRARAGVQDCAAGQAKRPRPRGAHHVQPVLVDQNGLHVVRATRPGALRLTGRAVLDAGTGALLVETTRGWARSRNLGRQLTLLRPSLMAARGLPAVDPSRPGRLFAMRGGRLLRSADDGVHWVTLPARIRGAGALAVDAGGLVYASAEGGLAISR